jgi:rhodanese-related sulfurtransferase
MRASGTGTTGIERGLALAAIIAGALAAVAGTPNRLTPGPVNVIELARIVEQEEDHVTARELAAWIRDDKTGLRILDIRPDSEFAEFHIPGATRVPLPEIARMPLDSAATYVLYSEGGTHAAQAWFLLRARGADRSYFLRGGLYEWLEQVMNPHVAASAPQAERDSVRALTLWFGGKMEIVDSSGAVGTTPSLLDGKFVAPRSPDAREAIRKVRRRAC